MAKSDNLKSTQDSAKSEKEKDVRNANIIAAKAVSDLIRTSLGPRGMDKMIVSPDKDVIITNDGATILKKLEVVHPCAKMLVDLSNAQDMEAGDGTTTVAVIAGALLGAVQKLMARSIHPTRISEAFLKAASKSEEILTEMGVPVDLTDKESLLHASTTSLYSKVVSQYSGVIAPMAVEAVTKVIDPSTAVTADLKDIRIVKRLGGTIDDSALIDGIAFTQGITKSSTGPSSIKNAKIGLIQFCISPPKTNMEGNIQVLDAKQMDRVFMEEKRYLADICKKIKKSGCNVLLIQKSILRDAITDLALHFLAKLKILVIKDIEREEIEFVSKTLGCTPVANIESFTEDKLGHADLVEEQDAGSEGKVVCITGVANPGRTVTVLLRGSNNLILDEAERSLHDALCVVRCLVKKKYLIVGGGAPEIEVALQLGRWCSQLRGVDAFCIQAFAEALEVVPYTLAENAGLNPIGVVTKLRQHHAQGEKNYGISVRKGAVADISSEHVLQPLLVSTSAIRLATETVCMILKIDDFVMCR